MAQAAPAFPVPNAPSSKKITLIAMVTALALILAIFLGLRATGLLRFGASQPQLDAMRAQGSDGQIPLNAQGSDGQAPLSAQGDNGQVPLSAQGSEPNGMLQKEGTPAAPVVTKQQTGMPDDIRKWLEHLEKIEKRKNDLSSKQLSQMMVFGKKMQVLGGGGMGLLGGEEGEEAGGDPEPSKQTKGAFDDLRPEWNQLIADFKSYPPPAECRPIADDYNRAINEIPGMNADLASILQTVANDPSNAATALDKVMKLQNTSTNVIDKYLRETDNKVGDICRKYETSKWFDIKVDVGGGMMSKFGM